MTALLVVVQHHNPQRPVQIEVAQHLGVDVEGIPVRVEAVLDVVGPVDGLPPRDAGGMVDQLFFQSKVAIRPIEAEQPSLHILHVQST